MTATRLFDPDLATWDEQYPGAERAPLDYPGHRPTDSFLYFDGAVLRIEQSPAGALLVHARRGEPTPLSELLDEANVPSLEDRFAVLAIGSNACPGRLKEKYRDSEPGVLIPVLRGRVAGLDIVYASYLAPYGAMPATCITAPGTRVEAWTTLLTGQQLETMNISENFGMGYQLVELPASFRVGRRAIAPPYAYYDRRILELDGGPIRLAANAASDARHPALAEREVLARVLDRVGYLPGRPIERRHERLVHGGDLAAVSGEIERRFTLDSAGLRPGVVADHSRLRKARWSDTGDEPPCNRMADLSG